MSRGKTRGCFPEDSQSDGCFPEAPAVPARFKCWPEPKGSKGSKGHEGAEDNYPERLLRYLTGEPR